MAAAALDDAVRNDDFGCYQIGIFRMVDDLRSRFKTKLIGVYIYEGQLRRYKLCKQKIVEGNIFWN